MPLFSTDKTLRTPFGKNVYLRSTRDIKAESYMFAAAGIPAETIDGFANQKVLQPGTILAKITSGGDAGKVGVFQAGATDGRQTATNIVGVNDTFLPWQLMEGDREVAAVYEAAVVQGWCFEYNAGGLRVALTNATRDAIRALPNVELLFK
jgi:hypothetical protein